MFCGILMNVNTLYLEASCLFIWNYLD